MIKKNDRILFQGDSITDAFRKPEEVCNAYQLGNGYAMMIAARLLEERPQDNLCFLNRGVSGQGIQALKKRWKEDCLDLNPTVLSVLVGINDAQVMEVSPRTTLEEFEKCYRELLELTKNCFPEIRLVLNQPFVFPVGAVKKERLEDVAERGEIVKRLAHEFDAFFLPLQEVLDEASKETSGDYWLYDGIHLTAQGHYLVAQTWLKLVGKSSF